MDGLTSLCVSHITDIAAHDHASASSYEAPSGTVFGAALTPRYLQMGFVKRAGLESNLE